MNSNHDFLNEIFKMLDYYFESKPQEHQTTSAEFLNKALNPQLLKRDKT